MYRWMVKLNLQIDGPDGIIEPDMIKCKYYIDANNFTEALAKAYNDMVGSDLIGCTGRVTHCVVKQIGEYE